MPGESELISCLNQLCHIYKSEELTYVGQRDFKMRLLLVAVLISLCIAVTGLPVKDSDFLHKDASGEEIHKNHPSQIHQRYRKSTSTSPSRSMKDRLSSLQTKFIQFTQKPAVQHLFKKLNDTVQNINATEVAENLGNLENMMGSLEENWDALTGDDAVQIAKAVCDIVGTVAAFIPPPAGIAISSVMGIVSAVLGMGGGEKQKSMGDVVQEVMEKQLKKQYVDEMKDRVQGAVDYLQLNQVFLNGFTGGNLSDRDYQFMITYFDHLAGISLRSELANLAVRLGKSKKVEDAKDAISVFDSYVVLTSMVEVLMHTMKSILEEDSRTIKSSENVALAIEAARRQSRRHLSILRQPKLENAILVANYDPAEHESVEKMLDNLHVKALSIDPGCYTVVNKHFNRAVFNFQFEEFKSMNVSSVFLGFRRNMSSLFEFRKPVDQDISTFGFGSFHMRYENGSMDFRGMGSLSGNSRIGTQFVTYLNETDQVPFKIMGFSDGGYMIINEKWPTNPLAMVGEEKYDTPVTADTQSWNEENPEYVWWLTKEEGSCSTRVANG